MSDAYKAEKKISRSVTKSARGNELKMHLHQTLQNISRGQNNELLEQNAWGGAPISGTGGVQERIRQTSQEWFKYS